MRPNFWNPKNRVVYILFPCFLLFSQVLSAQTIYSRATGNWQNTNTWSTVGHSGATCNCTPGPSDVVAIASGHVVTFLSGNTATVSSLSISGTLTLGSGTNATGLTVTGAVIVNTGATLSSGGSTNEHTLTIGGNITNNGSISLTSAVHKLVLNGNTDRTISGTGSTFTVHNFDLATIGSSNIALQRNLQINGTLNFTNNGLIILNTSANLTLGTTAAFGAGGNAPGGSKYIVVDESSASNGQLIKLNGNNVNHWRLLYPIGTVTGGYNPLDLSLSTIAPAPTNNSSLAIKAIYNQSIPGQLRRSFRLTVSGNAQATTLTNANFAYSSTTDVSTGDALPSYTLIRYTNTSGVTSIVNGTAPGSGSFTAPSAAITLNNGSHFFTIGSSAVWYSYQDGNWSNWEVWTQDPSGTSLINPLAQIPLPGDQIVILNGFTVTANLDDRVLSNTTIEGGAVLDMGTRLNNNLGVVEGSGWLRINGVNLPAGTYTTFVGNGGGTIEYYNTSGTLPTGQTTYNNLVLSNSTNASIVFTNLNNLTVNGNIEISQTSGSGTVTWRINDNTNTSRTISLNGNLTVSAQGRIRAGTGNRTSTTQHSLTILGSIINNGSIKFFDDTDATLSDANFTSGTIYTAALRGNAVNVTFAGTGNQTVTADGATDFYRLIVDKGTGQQSMLVVTSTSTSNFRLFGPNNQNYSGTVPNYTSNNNLSIVNGTLQLNGHISIPSLVVASGVGISGGWPIPQTGALWINSPNVTVQVTNTADTGDNGRQLYVFGLLRISGGTLNTGYSRGILGGGSGVILVEDGTVHTWQLRTTYLGSNNRFAFIQRGGVVNVGTTITTGPAVNQYPRFALPYSECTFEMTNGTLNVGTPIPSGISATGGVMINAANSNINVSGGTVNISLPASNINFTINSTAPFFNLNISKLGAGTSGATLNSLNADDSTNPTSPGNINLPARPLTILSNLTLIQNNTPAFVCNGNNLTIGGNFAIQTGTTFTPGANTITFNGAGAQNWSNNGTITSLNNIVIEKTDVLTLAGTNAFPNSGNISGLTLTSGTLADGGKTLVVTTILTNSATHTGTGVINATGPTSIGGSNGIFGNLTITTDATVATSGNQTVTGTLRLININSSLNIGSNNLTVNGSIFSNATTGVAFSSTKRIITNGLRNDGGLTRQGTGGNLLFPIGTSTVAYSPVTISVAASTHGKITVRPVRTVHPNAPTGQSLQYYWRVTSEGYSGVTSVSHNTYTFSTTGLLQGTAAELAAYKPSRYNPSTFTWSVGTTYNAAGTTVIPNFSFGTNIDGEYTTGNITAGTLTVYYSRQTGSWGSTDTWSSNPCSGPGTCGTAASTLPCSTCPVVIGDANNNHTVTIDVSARTCGSLLIATGSTLDCSTFVNLNFGVNTGETVSGRGTLRIASAIFPAGDFSNFIGPEGGTVEWYGASKTIPSTGAAPQNLALSSYYNLIINPTPSGQTITLPAQHLTVHNDFTKTGAGTLQTNTTAARTLAVNGNLSVNAGSFSLQSGNSYDFTVAGNTTIASGATFAPANTTARTHTFTTSGSINNSGTLTFRSTNHVVNLTFTGADDAVLNGAPGSSTSLNLLTVDKGTSDAPSLSLTGSGTLTTLNTTGWLSLSNGNVIFNKPGHTFTLVNTAATFTIPSTGRLTVQQGTVNITNFADDAADLILSGTLDVQGGTVNIGSSGNDRHNDIEYASAGLPTILVSGGTLYVNGGVRRSLLSLAGALVYNQSGGTVTIGGRNTNATNTRGVFEIENNSGSNFTLTGGTLTLVRPNNGTSFADLYLNPETASVSPSSTIQIGQAAGPATFEINIVPPIGNLITSTAETVDLQSSALTTTGTLTINTGSTLRTNALDVAIGGNLVINGTGVYNGTISGGNTTTFNGAGAQSASLTAGSTFQNITVDKSSGTVSLSGTSPTINNLNILNGVLDVGSLGLTVQGDIVNNSSQIGSGAIVMSGTSTIQYITSSNGSFTNVTLAGSGPSKNVRVSGNVSIAGTLNFSSDYRYLSIGSNLLTFGTSGAVTGANNTRFIRTNGAASDLGVVKQYAVGATSFKFEIGSLNYYTPVTFNATITAAGTLTAIPVNQRHSTANLASSEQILNYYWILSRNNSLSYNASGSHVYTFPAGLLTGSGGALVAGYLDLANPVGWITSSHGGSAASGTMTFTNQLNTNLPGQNNSYNYTVGTINTLPNPIEPIYSRLATPAVANTAIGGSWIDGNSWTTAANGMGVALAGAPPLGVPVVILPGARINMDQNARAAFTTQINGLLVVGTTTQHNLGTLSGTGTLRTSTNTFPAGNYTAFVSAVGGTIEYVGTLTMNSRSVYNNVSFIGPGTATMTNTDLTLNGSWSIGSGVTVNNPSNRNITLARNWSNSGTFNAGTGTVTFNGTATQTVTGTTTFNNLVINKPTGNIALTGTGNTQISNTLTLTSGHIIASATHPVSLINTTTNITGGSSSSFIAGVVNKAIAAGSSFTFPLGSISPGRYRPASINATTDLNTWTIEYVGNEPSAHGYSNLNLNTANIGTVSEFEYWNVSRTGTAAAGLTLTYNAESYNPPNIGNVANLRIARWNGTQWDLPPGSGVHTQSGTNITGTVSVTNVTSFSPFTLASLDHPSALPVRWLSFAGERVARTIVLKWSTATETDNDYFEIERSEDGKRFSKIGITPGAGTRTVIAQYEFTDKNIFLSERYYYRLKQVDYNGKSQYSNVIVINSTEETDRNRWAVYPNPSTRQEAITLKAVSKKGTSVNVTLAIHAPNGSIVYRSTGTVEDLNDTINDRFTDLPAGVYILQISEGGYYEVFRLIRY